MAESVNIDFKISCEAGSFVRDVEDGMRAALMAFFEESARAAVVLREGSGNALDRTAAMYSLARRPGETDAQLRGRVLHAAGRRGDTMDMPWCVDGSAAWRE